MSLCLPLDNELTYQVPQRGQRCVSDVLFRLRQVQHRRFWFFDAMRRLHVRGGLRMLQVMRIIVELPNQVLYTGQCVLDQERQVVLERFPLHLGVGHGVARVLHLDPLRFRLWSGIVVARVAVGAVLEGSLQRHVRGQLEVQRPEAVRFFLDVRPCSPACQYGLSFLCLGMAGQPRRGGLPRGEMAAPTWLCAASAMVPIAVGNAASGASEGLVANKVASKGGRDGGMDTAGGEILLSQSAGCPYILPRRLVAVDTQPAQVTPAKI